VDYNFAVNAFEDYVKKFEMKDKISMKYKHTYCVVRLMEKLAKRLQLSEEEINLAKIIGLLHDIGRFKQVDKTGDFNDLQSNIDHAEVGCDYLFKNNHIRDFVLDDKYDKVIYNAIKYHNKLTIDESIDEESLLFSKMIRDMDKVDIFRFLAVNFEYELIKEDVKELVINDFKNKTLVKRENVKTLSDDTLVYLAFVYDINFKDSYDLLEETDNLGLFISSLSIPKYSEEFASEIFDKVNSYVEERINNYE